MVSRTAPSRALLLHRGQSFAHLAAEVLVEDVLLELRCRLPSRVTVDARASSPAARAPSCWTRYCTIFCMDGRVYSPVPGLSDGLLVGLDVRCELYCCSRPSKLRLRDRLAVPTITTALRARPSSRCSTAAARRRRRATRPRSTRRERRGDDYEGLRSLKKRLRLPGADSRIASARTSAASNLSVLRVTSCEPVEYTAVSTVERSERRSSEPSTSGPTARRPPRKTR